MYRKNFCVIVAVVLGALAVLLNSNHVRSQEAFKKDFVMPPARYGSAPFWSWNEVLEPDELIHQIDEFAEQGMGGFFMHAREGLITEYMGPEWMKAVRLSVDRAKEKGLIAYMYDEDRWPSGFASGKVPAMSVDYRQKGLLVLESDTPLAHEKIRENGDLLRIFEAVFDGDNLSSFKPVDTAPQSPGGTLLYFVMGTAQPTEWFNGQTYIDTLNPAAVDAFIKVTHEEYKKVIGDEFGKVVPAIFADEPELLARRHFSYDVVPWTGALPDTFKKTYSYDILDNLPLLFFDGPGAAPVRLDFWTTATEMFRDAFFKRIYEWGEANDVEFTGHLMLEDTLMSQIWRIGAAMPHYEYMQFPGMDHLGRNIDNLLTAKQVSSVAHQFSRPLILTELYGCSGWNLSFENMKWIADWHYVLGVNFMNQHLSWYSMRGARKRDYPTTIQYQSPWWNDYHVVADYMRRATYATAQGRFVAETLVLHPINAAWAAYTPSGKGDVSDLHDHFNSLLYTLTGNQVDYDLGDEIIISRHGAVRDGKFVVKDAAYSVVVIPDMYVMRASTMELLKEFLAQGGTVVAIGNKEYRPHGESPEKLDGAVVAADIDDAIKKLDGVLDRHVMVTGKNGAATNNLFLHQRDIDGALFLFFANTDQDNGIDVDVRIPAKGRVDRWNLFDGAVSPEEYQADEDCVSLSLHFEPAGSVLLSVTPTDAPPPPANPEPQQVRTQPLPDAWKIVERGPNALTIDSLAYKRAGDKAWISNVAYHTAQGSMQAMETDGFQFAIKYKFGLGVEPSKLEDIFLVMEQPEGKEILVNDRPVSYSDAGWWIDPSFKKVVVKAALHKGKNEIEVRGAFHTPKKPGTRIYVPGGTEIESIYIVGDFSVVKTKSGNFVITPPDDSFAYGDMAEKGYPFFSGTISVEQAVDVQPGPGERVVLDIQGLDAITARVRVNGDEAGLIAFHPHRIDITDFVTPGQNTVRIELTTSNRNLLGPHHAEQREPLNVGPGTFTSEIFRNVYHFIPMGISDGVSLVYYK